MEWRNPKFNVFGTVDVEINHPAYGWVWFTASPDDTEVGMRMLHDEVIAVGNIAPYEPPPEQPVPVPEEISRRQFYQVLAKAGKITKAEALAAIQYGAIPAALQTIIDGMMNEEDAFEAQMLLAGATTFYRSHPFVLVIAITHRMTEAEMDDLWRAGSVL